MVEVSTTITLRLGVKVTLRVNVKVGLKVRIRVDVRVLGSRGLEPATIVSGKPLCCQANGISYYAFNINILDCTGKNL